MDLLSFLIPLLNHLTSTTKALVIINHNGTVLIKPHLDKGHHLLTQICLLQGDHYMIQESMVSIWSNVLFNFLCKLAAVIQQQF